MSPETFLLLVVAAVLGALMHRVRGGLLNILAAKYGLIKTKNAYGELENPYLKTAGKLSNDIVYGLFNAALLGFTWHAALILSGAMMLGRHAGWGAYIMGMIQRKVLHEKEVEFIDEIVLQKDNYPYLRNAIALSLRGLLFTGALYLGFSVVGDIGGSATPFDVALLLSGLLMGGIYAISIEFAGKYKNNRHLGWGYGEYLIGGLLWLVSALRTLA